MTEPAATAAPLGTPLAPASEPPPATAAALAGASSRFAMLDGWRAASILLVLAGHFVPLSPKWLQFNAMAAASGMAIFFTLSGFLITRFMASRADLRVFILRRFFRIVPLAWVVMAVLLIANASGPEAWAANLLFYSNLPPAQLVHGGEHLWSLCVEMQFYVGIALFVALFTSRSLIVLPLIALAITALRIADQQMISIVTWHRVDEILAGGVLALIYAGWYGTAPQRLLAWLNPYWLIPLLLASAHPEAGALQYARPYLTALTVGASLYGAPVLLTKLFENRVAAYVATTSYALYIFHAALAVTWLGSGEDWVRYAKRPLLLAATFGLAHLSTFKFEQPCIALAKRLTRGLTIKAPA